MVWVKIGRNWMKSPQFCQFWYFNEVWSQMWNRSGSWAMMAWRRREREEEGGGGKNQPRAKYRSPCEILVKEKTRQFSQWKNVIPTLVFKSFENFWNTGWCIFISLRCRVEIYCLLKSLRDILLTMENCQLSVHNAGGVQQLISPSETNEVQCKAGLQFYVHLLKPTRWL